MHHKSKWTKAFLIIAIAAFFIQFGLGLQRTVINIFMEGPLGLDGDQVGLVAGIREVPGLLTVALALIAVFFSESVFAALCVALTCLGLVMISRVTNMPELLVATLVYSTGFHLYFPVQSAMVLGVAESEQRAARLGQINAVAAMASLAAIAVARILDGRIAYRYMFLIAAVVAGVSIFVFLLRRSGDSRLEKNSNQLRKGLVFKLKYSSYYVLTLLSGSRRHITQTFAIYLLLRVFNVEPKVVLNLTLISTALSIVTRPYLGKLVDRIGESRGLTLNYAIVLVLFLFYAFSPSRQILYIVFVIDQLCIGFDVGITTHLSKIADEGDLKPSLAMGSTINHVTGVLVPIVGGYMFKNISPASTFLLGALVCLASLVQAYKLPKAREDVVTEVAKQ